MRSSGVYVVEAPIPNKPIGQVFVFHSEQEALKKKKELARQGHKDVEMWEM